MFTGLIESVGRIAECQPVPAGVRLRIETALSGELTPGDSVAVNGTCLTVTSCDQREVSADVGPETLRVTSLGRLGPGSLVNLERSLRADSRFGGHFVLGHVDGTGVIEALRPDADFTWITIRFPGDLAPYIIPKGSIAVDGISLTVARLGDERLDVMIIPFTLEHTNLKDAKVGDPVNLECDMVGKYVVRAAELGRLSPAAAAAGDARQ